MSVLNAPIAATISDLNQIAAPATQMFKNMRGSKALAELIGNVKEAIDRIRREVPEEVIAEWFISKGIIQKGNSTSIYPAFIAAICGEEHLEGKKFTSDINGKVYPIWVPDRSMEIYFHTMEELDHLGIRANYKDAIMNNGGAAKMARNRQKRINSAAKPSLQAEAEIQLKTLITKTEKTPLKGVKAPKLKDETQSKFFTLLCYSEGNEVVSLGVVDANAGVTARKMAKARYAQLSKAQPVAVEAKETKLMPKRQAYQRVKALQGLEDASVNEIFAKVSAKRGLAPATASKKSAA
jgi:hypothetical protein